MYAWKFLRVACWKSNYQTMVHTPRLIQFGVQRSMQVNQSTWHQMLQMVDKDNHVDQHLNLLAETHQLLLSNCIHENLSCSSNVHTPIMRQRNTYKVVSVAKVYYKTTSICIQCYKIVSRQNIIFAVFLNLQIQSLTDSPPHRSVKSICY